MLLWRQLKGWQKGGLIFGGGHFLIYFLILAIFGPIAALVLGALEYPWAFIMSKLGIFSGIGASGYGDLVLVGAVGTLVYYLCGMGLFLLIQKFLLRSKVDKQE